MVRDQCNPESAVTHPNMTESHFGTGNEVINNTVIKFLWDRALGIHSAI